MLGTTWSKTIMYFNPCTQGYFAWYWKGRATWFLFLHNEESISNCSSGVGCIIVHKYWLLSWNLSQCWALACRVVEERGREKAPWRGMYVLVCTCVLCTGAMEFRGPALGSVTQAISRGQVGEGQVCMAVRLRSHSGTLLSTTFPSCISQVLISLSQHSGYPSSTPIQFL